MPTIQSHPDFNRFLDTLLLRKAYQRPPQFDFHVAAEHKARWLGRFCLLGNIDLDLMSRGSEADVERRVRDRIDRLNPAGGYMPGVSNTVPYYVKFENYQRMIQTVHSYAD